MRRDSFCWCCSDCVADVPWLQTGAGDEHDHSGIAWDLTNENVVDDKEEDADEEPQGHVVYGSLDELNKQFLDRKPISVVVSEPAEGILTFQCYVCGQGRKWAVELKLKDDGEFSCYTFGLHYHEFEIVKGFELVDWSKTRVLECGVLLPLDLKPNADGTLKHRLRTGFWAIFRPVGNFAPLWGPTA